MVHSYFSYYVSYNQIWISWIFDILKNFTSNYGGKLIILFCNKNKNYEINI